MKQIRALARLHKPPGKLIQELEGPTGIGDMRIRSPVSYDPVALHNGRQRGDSMAAAARTRSELSLAG